MLPVCETDKPTMRVARWAMCEDSPFGPTAAAWEGNSNLKSNPSCHAVRWKRQPKGILLLRAGIGVIAKRCCRGATNAARLDLQFDLFC